jgi:hypothetical protein
LTALRFNVRSNGAIQPVEVNVRDLVIAGWTGRNQAEVQRHINELAEIGVQPPKSTPVFYRVSASLATTANAIQTIGADSSGETEFVLIHDAERLLVGVGSDHTDRKAETISVAISKQMCPKPLGSEVWEFSTVEPHWDDLILRSYLIAGRERVLYQEGSVAAILHPKTLLERYSQAAGRAFSAGMTMFGGTLPVIGALRPASEFAIELEDPVFERTLTHTYSISQLPIET